MNVMIRVTILVLKASNANSSSNHVDDKYGIRTKGMNLEKTVLDPEPLKLNAFGTELQV